MNFSITQNCPPFPLAFVPETNSRLSSRSLVPKTGDLSRSLVLQVSPVSFVVVACIGAKFGVNGTPGELPKWYAIVVVVFICTYVARFAWSWGPLRWLVSSEIFPLEIRSATQSINILVNMIIFIMAQIFLTMLCHLKIGLFIFSAFFVFVMSIFVYYFLPETKGIPIEEMGQVWRSHWYWKRFVSAKEEGGYEMERAAQTIKNV